MKTIRVDDQVFGELQRQAVPFVDTPNAVLRRLLGLGGGGPAPRTATDAPAFLIPHNRKEFATADALRRWLDGKLRAERAGRYYVASGSGWSRIPPGATCAFHKDKLLVGDAVVEQGLQYGESDLSPATGRPYVGSVTFRPESIRTFDPPIPFDEAAAAADKGLTWRAIQELTRSEYEQVLALR